MCERDIEIENYFKVLRGFSDTPMSLTKSVLAPLLYRGRSLLEALKAVRRYCAFTDDRRSTGDLADATVEQLQTPFICTLSQGW